MRLLAGLGIAVPILFLFLIEAFRFFVIENDPIQRAEHVAIAVVIAIGTVGFALSMFRLIERAERRIVRQNRELTAINAVSTAIQGELGVEQILDAALEVVVERTSATEGSLLVYAHEQQPGTALERTLVVAPHATPGAVGSEEVHLIDIPLARGQQLVGRLRLHLPEGVAEADLPTVSTLQNIGHQLACSIEIGQLVSDLRRRTAEGRALYEILLLISSQKPLSAVLDAIVNHAREQFHADKVTISLNKAVSPLLNGTAPAEASPADGSTCITATADRNGVGGDPGIGGPVALGQGAASVRVMLSGPEGPMGELSCFRVAELPFNPREEAYLQTLAELAGIAITGARMREKERQSTIVAERDRIAREMHDSLAQVLGTAHLRLRALETHLGTTRDTHAATEVRDLADLAEDAYRDVREAILGLRESSRPDRGLLESLRAYLDRYSRQCGVKTTLDTDLAEVSGLSPGAEVHVIRVIQEALSNVRKHAHAAAATVRVESDDISATFTIEDSGRGFDLASALLDRDARFGLHTMRERIGLVGGELSIESTQGQGTRVVARVPRVPVGDSPPEPVHVG